VGQTVSTVCHRHDHFIVQKHLSKIVQPISIEVVFLFDNLDALTEQSISSLQSIFVEPEDVYVFGGTGCIGE
jgi:hypothetical protein